MKRPAGRPPLDQADRSVQVSFSLPSKQLEAVSEQAKQDRVTVQDWLRRLVRTAVPDELIAKK
jgi:hypothetical protein